MAESYWGIHAPSARPPPPHPTPPLTVPTVLPGGATQIFEVLFFYMSTVELEYCLQKQPPEMSYKKSCSEKFRKFYIRTLQHRCFPVKFAKFVRTPILKNIR